MENSKIEWTNHTANLWWGCMKVHAGCDNCYAETLDGRYNADQPHWGAHANRKIVNGVWKDLAKFQRDAAAENTIKRVFVGSMMDIFEKPYPVEDSKGNLIPSLTTGDLRDRLFQDIVPNSPNLLFLLLTKRPSNINKYIPFNWKINPPQNVMFGTSIVDQPTANQLVPELLEVKGKRFLSCEPLIGYVNLELTMNEMYPENLIDFIDWVIVGGESGNQARPMNKEWAISLLKQCRSAKVPFFFKQWGEWTPLNPYSDAYGTQYYTGFLDGEHRPLQNNTPRLFEEHYFEWHQGDSTTKSNKSIKVGKKLAGAMLNHNTYKEFPDIKL